MTSVSKRLHAPLGLDDADEAGAEEPNAHCAGTAPAAGGQENGTADEQDDADGHRHHALAVLADQQGLPGRHGGSAQARCLTPGATGADDVWVGEDLRTSLGEDPEGMRARRPDRGRRCDSQAVLTSKRQLRPREGRGVEFNQVTYRHTGQFLIRVERDDANRCGIRVGVRGVEERDRSFLSLLEHQSAPNGRRSGVRIAQEGHPASVMEGHGAHTCPPELCGGHAGPCRGRRSLCANGTPLQPTSPQAPPAARERHLLRAP